MVVNLYRFGKRKNSTKRPSGTAKSVDVQLKEGDTSLLSPSLLLHGLTDMTQYNYLYIPKWYRYYYIDDISVTAQGLYELHCSIDALASWRDDLENHQWYVTRCSNSMVYNTYIPDKMYPMTSCANTEVSVASPFGTALSDVYIIGIVGKGGDTAATYYSAGVQYFAITSVMLGDLMHQLLNTTSYLDITSAEASEGLQKALVNPFQYIQSIYALPLNSLSDISGTQQSIRLGWWDFTATGVPIYNGTQYTRTVTISIPNHPQYSTRGNYLNLSPYSNYTLYAPPFGTIPLDSTYFVDGGSITCNITINAVPGTAILRISSGGKTMQMLKANVAVPQTVAMLTQDIQGGRESLFNGIMGTASAAVGTAVSAITGNIPGLVSSIASFSSGFASYGDYRQAMTPKLQSSGGTPDYSEWVQPWRLLIQRFNVADEDLAHLGRPCGKNITPIDVGEGFYVVADPDIGIPATPTEKTQISAYLTGGFFYE